MVRNRFECNMPASEEEFPGLVRWQQCQTKMAMPSLILHKHSSLKDMFSRGLCQYCMQVRWIYQDDFQRMEPPFGTGGYRIDRSHVITAILWPLGVAEVSVTCVRVRWVSHTWKYTQWNIFLFEPSDKSPFWTNSYHVGFRYEATLNFHTYFGQCPNDIYILLHMTATAPSGHQMAIVVSRTVYYCFSSTIDVELPYTEKPERNGLHFVDKYFQMHFRNKNMFLYFD